MPALSKKDLEYHIEFIEEQRTEHRYQMINKNQPHRLVQAYEGFLHGDRVLNDDLHDKSKHHYGDADETVDIANSTPMENLLFIATNTLIPTLFFQNPRPIVTTEKDKRYELSAAILMEVAKHYINTQFKKENQSCIMDGWFSGYAVMKNGYNTVTKTVPKSKLLNFVRKQKGLKPLATPSSMEEETEFIDIEHPVIERQDPIRTYLDHTKEWGKDEVVTFDYARTLYEVKKAKMYKLSANFLSHFGAKEDDDRKVKLTLTESYRMIDGFAWKLVLIKGWPEELLWVRTDYKQLPISIMRFNNPPGVKYPVSHMRLGTDAQRELDYLNMIWKKNIDKTKNLTFMDGTGLNEQARRSVENADIGDFVWNEGPIVGKHAEIKTQPLSADVFANIEAMRNYLKQVLSTSGAKVGESATDFAVQDRIAALGDQLRTSGMTDEIRMFAVDQIKQLVKNLIKFGSPELSLRITSKGITTQDEQGNEVPVTGKVINIPEGKLKDFIIGDIDRDYDFDINISSAQKPDMKVTRLAMVDAIKVLGEVIEPRLQQSGKVVDWEEMGTDLLKTFEEIPNASKYIRDMSEEEQKALADQAKKQNEAEEIAKDAQEVETQGKQVDSATKLAKVDIDQQKVEIDEKKVELDKKKLAQDAITGKKK